MQQQLDVERIYNFVVVVNVVVLVLLLMLLIDVEGF